MTDTATRRHAATGACPPTTSPTSASPPRASAASSGPSARCRSSA